jgi:hypothetical protein
MPRFCVVLPHSARALFQQLGSRWAGEANADSAYSSPVRRPSALRRSARDHSALRRSARGHSPLRRSALALAAGVTAAALLTGCSVVEEFGSHQKEQVFATWADAAQGDNAPFAAPLFVPEDATEVRMRGITNGPGKLLRWAGSSPVAAKSCEPGALTGAPLLESTWWPAQIPREGMVCSAGWQLFQKDGYTYGWASV